MPVRVGEDKVVGRGDGGATIIMEGKGRVMVHVGVKRGYIVVKR